ncbi:hypothetical protein HQ865_03150 [Mucilaginibacter mali]|uniref:DUF5017 domain-containing protein n=1 Tax=Mucilaginibacter mali TaxID=2740462 RepID=A0A7D4TVS6_9SPHI|nr:hypothetical protein [Mucilaginibacter mali]QKJ28797.1 hypothetical protein HQ865_03150 [Mucilaginibacter mali]
MKRIYYFVAFVSAVAAFTACKPLNKTYDTLGDVPGPAAPTMPYTLTSAEYKLLNKGAGAYTSLYFKSADTAKAQIPTILASRFATYPVKTTVSVTYNSIPVTIKLADSTLATTAITLQTTPTSDYRWTAFTYNGLSISANNFDDLSATAVINWLRYKNQTPPAENSLRVLTYLYFESNVTASSGTLQTDAFLYTAANDWQKIYRVSNAQYASVNRGNNNAFVSSDAANLPTYFNNFLKADATTFASAKVGNVIYVNYKYQTSATVSYQRVLPLMFDGTNWTTAPIPVTLSFVKTTTGWVADNTVNYKLTTADYQYIKTMPTTVNIQTALDNVAQFGDYNVSVPVSPTTGWTDAQVNASLILIMAKNFTKPELNQVYNITYVAYNGSTFNATKKFVYDGTTFVYKP